MLSATSCVAESVNGRRRRFVSVPEYTHSASDITDRTLVRTTATLLCAW